MDTMVRTQIYLTEQEHLQLHRLAKRQGATVSELVRAAIDQMLAHRRSTHRLEALREARGIWKDRNDLPDFRELRGEWDRTQQG
jgi:Arc/MetJ-type ribon-helix-helix transcriptional regulator